MHNERVIIMWGKCHSLVPLVTQWAVNFQIWRTLLSFSPLSIIAFHIFLEFETKRNSLKNTRSMYIVFVRFYFCEKNAAFRRRKPLKAEIDAKSPGFKPPEVIELFFFSFYSPLKANHFKAANYFQN